MSRSTQGVAAAFLAHFRTSRRCRTVIRGTTYYIVEGVYYVAYYEGNVIVYVEVEF